MGKPRRVCGRTPGWVSVALSVFVAIATAGLTIADTTPGANTTTATGNGQSPFTDHPLTPRSTLIRASHITELRLRIDALRIRFGLTEFRWNDPSLTPNITPLRAQHIVDLRVALSGAYVAVGLMPPTFTDPGLVAGATVPATHVTELRAAVVAIEAVVTVTTTSPLPAGTQGTAYSTTLAATGGTGSYTWDVTSGTLPGGLSLGPSTGTISGTPTANGTFPFTVQATSGVNLRA